VTPGANRVELVQRALGGRRGRGTLRVNGTDVATLDFTPTTILGLGVGEGLDIGLDRGQHVTHYGDEGPCRYSGRVGHVRIEPGAQAADSYANRREIESQRD
jgi:arylsulfatase